MASQIKLSEDEVDDLLYFARVGETSDFEEAVQNIRTRENCALEALLEITKDEHSGNGILHMIAANGHADLLTKLLTSMQASSFSALPSDSSPLSKLLNIPNLSGNRALHYAALNGHLSCVKLLIDAGADPTLKNNAGHDPVYEAEINDKTDVVDWVLKEGGEGLESGVAGDQEDGDEEEGEPSETLDDEEENRESHGDDTDTKALKEAMDAAGLGGGKLS